MNKEELREHMLQQRTAMELEFHLRYSEQVCETLKRLTLINEHKVIHAFIPIRNEVNILPFLSWALDNEMKVVCPKVIGKRQLQHLELQAIDQLEQGKFDTFYPTGNSIYNGEIDLILVPGLAFDSNLNRLGYGGGFYDAFMRLHPESFKLALPYPFQVIDSVPTEDHDMKVDDLITSYISTS